jgi:hypothetical protein
MKTKARAPGAPQKRSLKCSRVPLEKCRKEIAQNAKQRGLQITSVKVNSKGVLLVRWLFLLDFWSRDQLGSTRSRASKTCVPKLELGNEGEPQKLSFEFAPFRQMCEPEIKGGTVRHRGRGEEILNHVHSAKPQTD